MWAIIESTLARRTVSDASIKIHIFWSELGFFTSLTKQGQLSLVVMGTGRGPHWRAPNELQENGFLPTTELELFLKAPNQYFNV